MRKLCVYDKRRKAKCNGNIGFCYPNVSTTRDPRSEKTCSSGGFSFRKFGRVQLKCCPWPCTRQRACPSMYLSNSASVRQCACPSTRPLFVNVSHDSVRECVRPSVRRPVGNALFLAGRDETARRTTYFVLPNFLILPKIFNFVLL